MRDLRQRMLSQGDFERLGYSGPLLLEVRERRDAFAVAKAAEVEAMLGNTLGRRAGEMAEAARRRKLQHAVTLLRRGRTQRDAAQAVGICPATLSQWLRRRG